MNLSRRLERPPLQNLQIWLEFLIMDLFYDVTKY